MFALFDAQWSRKFKSMWPSREELNRSKRAWARSFAKCDYLNAETLAAGLERVTQQDWPPDNPGEFLKLCHRTPDMVRAPDFDAAHSEACRGAYPYNTWHKWSHKAVYWAATWTGLSDLNERPNQVRKRFEREYQKALDQFEKLPEPPKGDLPPPVKADTEGVDGDGFKAFEAMKKKCFG